MTHNIIKAGYRLTVVSWENDLDNYNTKTSDGLSKEECQFKVDCCKLLSNGSEFRNMYEPTKKELNAFSEALKPLVEKHKDYLSSQVEEIDFDDPYVVTDFMYDLGLSCGEFFTRVCESYKVEYIPEDILIEDVTDQF